MDLHVYSYAGTTLTPALQAGVGGEGADGTGVLGLPLSIWNLCHMSELEQVGSEPRVLSLLHLG